MVYAVYYSTKKVYKKVYKGVDIVHEIVYLIGGSTKQTQAPRKFTNHESEVQNGQE